MKDSKKISPKTRKTQGSKYVSPEEETFNGIRFLHVGGRFIPQFHCLRTNLSGERKMIWLNANEVDFRNLSRLTVLYLHGMVAALTSLMLRFPGSPKVWMDWTEKKFKCMRILYIL